MALSSKVPVIHILAVILGSLEIVLFGGVIFGWHSVVYIYKDIGYFSEKCPARKSTMSPNITWHYQVPGSVNSSKYYSDHVNISRIDSDGRFSALHVNRFQNSTERSSIHFDSLSCEEKMQVRRDESGSQICKSQDEQFNLIFSVATGINGMMSFPSGILYDRLGTRISRISSLVSFMAGQLCLIFASPTHPYLLYPGFIGLVFGGYQILLTNLQLSCLIPSYRSTIMSLYSGSYDTSASIFLLFKVAYEQGTSINTSFVIQATFYFLIFASSTFFLLPKTRIPFPLTPGFRLRCYLSHKFCGKKDSTTEAESKSDDWTMDKTGSIILKRAFSVSADSLEASRDVSKASAEQDESEKSNGFLLDYEKEIAAPVLSDVLQSGASENAEISEANCSNELKNVEAAMQEADSILSGEATHKRKTFRQVALSPLFLTDVMWISVQRLRSWIFIGMFNPWITRLACGDRELVSHYTSVYAGMQFFGILTAPLSGRLMDRKIKSATKYGDSRFERLHASIASFVLNSSVSVLLTICTLIPILKLQYLTFVLHCLHRSFLYGPNSAFVANGFPNEHFGKLFGVTLTVSAMFSMIQYPLFLIMQGPLHGNPLAINLFLLVLMIISYIHPIYIWRYLQKKVSKASQ